jgi:hypothetical protein
MLSFITKSLDVKDNDHVLSWFLFYFIFPIISSITYIWFECVIVNYHIWNDNECSNEMAQRCDELNSQNW